MIRSRTQITKIEKLIFNQMTLRKNDQLSLT